MTLMTDGLTALHSLMNSHASVTITYARGGNSVAVSAVPGELVYEQTASQAPIDKTRREWFVLAADLILAGSTITPQRDDTITYAADDRTETYRVFGDSVDPPWEYTDSGHELIAVRSILTAVS